MKSFTERLNMNVAKKRDFVNITQKIQNVVEKSKIKEGLCLVNSMHITSSIFINDEEQGLKEDFMEWLEDLAPEGDYKHHETGEDNADAHLKRTIMGREVVLAITDSKLDLGPWEQVFYGEFDGLREKQVMIKIIGE